MINPKNSSIHKGNCLELMKDIPDGSIDMILCDLPYGTTACKWDTIIPFEPLWEQYKRVIKDNGAIVLTACQPFTSALVMSNAKMFKYDWTWRKPAGTGHLNAKKQPLRDKEDVLVFYGKQCVYNPQFSKGEPYTALKGGKTTKKVKAGSGVYGAYCNGKDHRSDNDGFRYPKQVIDNPVVGRGTIHPTQKPVPLFEYLIKTYTNEGETVLDNCAGSFTTAIACLNTKRKYICMEQEDKYFSLGENRIAEWHKEAAETLFQKAK